jgi:DNA-binding MarR family transcriptional regulator
MTAPASDAAATASRTRLYHRVQLAARALQRRADRDLMATAGISTSQAAVLAVIASQGTSSQCDIARQLGIQESAMTTMTLRLLKSDLIVRARDPEDARTWRLTLTDHGQALLAVCLSGFAGINAALAEALTEEEMEMLAKLLDRLANIRP